MIEPRAHRPNTVMSLNNPPLVSVCIPTYLGANFIRKTIESVLQQSYSNIEIWVVDDSSPDSTRSVVSGLRDERIKYIRNPINLGPQGNWNKCLDLACGKYFMILPHDDLLAEDSLRQQVSVLESDDARAIALVFGSRQLIDPSGKTLMTRRPSRLSEGRISGHDLIRHCIRAGTNQIGEPGNVLSRAELVGRLGGYDASFPYVIDLDFWFRLLQHGDGYYTATPTSSFRLLPSSWSVAIGGKQYRDFKGIVDKYAKYGGLGITKIDRIVGLTKARVYCYLRALIYLWVFNRNREPHMWINEVRSLFEHSQIIRFLIVGAINTCFSLSVYAILIFFGLHYAVANFVSLIAGILLGFKSQGSIVFQQKDNRLLGRFLLTWAFIYAGTSYLIGQIVAWGANAYAAGIAALPFSTVLSFLAQKFFVFRKSSGLRSNQ
jgi:glycosyltransferase involved in cell wall biosynthesis